MQAILISKMLKIPLVGTYHTAISEPQYLKHIKLDNSFAKKISWFYSRLFYNKCDLITCPSKSMKKELIANSLKKNIKVISNGIESQVFDNSNSLSVKKKLNKNGELVLFVGRIAHEKNIFYLLECFRIVLDKMPEVKFVIVGQGPQMEDFKEKISSLGMTKNIRLLGRIEHDDFVKSSIFGACKVFATASLTETQGITLLEAQANGIVGVGVNAKGTKDLIIDGYNGYLVKNGRKKEFANRIITLLTDKKLYNNMRKNTLKEIRKHEMDNIINIWEDVYSRVIAKKISLKNSK